MVKGFFLSGLKEFLEDSLTKKVHGHLVIKQLRPCSFRPKNTSGRIEVWSLEEKGKNKRFIIDVYKHCLESGVAFSCRRKEQVKIYVHMLCHN